MPPEALDVLALIGKGTALSYRQLIARIDAYAGWALRYGIGRGDVVALLMRNSPEYLAIWLGICRVGGVVALLNTQQTGVGLVHAVETVAPKHLIAGGDLAEAALAVWPTLSRNVTIWTHADHAEARRIDTEIAGHCHSGSAASGYRAPTLADRALCIYTSGTTGLPKAANVSHFPSCNGAAGLPA